MDFDQMPDIVFLRIFDYLPLKDQFRVGRVSQSFRRISLDVNSRMKSLDLDVPMFQRPDMVNGLFFAILSRCQHNLREIKFCGLFGFMPMIFSQYTFPQLVNLDLNRNDISDDNFARMITNHPNLKRIKWASLGEDENGRRYLRRVEFPPVTLSNLETLDIEMMNDATLERLIDRCPNLKNLEIILQEASSDDILDGFFRSVPRLESLRLAMIRCQIRVENLEWFWRLPLTSLAVKYYEQLDMEFMINDDFVYKLIERFKNIEYLNLLLINASDEAVAALAQLEKLRVAKLDVTNTEFTDVTIREFTACRTLEVLYVYYNLLSDQTFLELFRNCPRLRKLYVCGVFDDDGGGAIDAETAGMLILELTNTPHRPSITIQISCCLTTPYQGLLELRSVWESVQVQNAVQQGESRNGDQHSPRGDASCSSSGRGDARRRFGRGK